MRLSHKLSEKPLTLRLGVDVMRSASEGLFF